MNHTRARYTAPSMKPFKMIRLALLICLLALSGFACLTGQPASDAGLAHPEATITHAPPGPQMARAGNPFGLMLGAAGLSLDERLRIVQDLGAAYFRPNTVRIEGWNGNCRECSEATAAGLKLILTVTNSGGGTTPSSPPEDLTQYQTVLREILASFPPEVLVVENEENSSWFYLGTPVQYGEQLRAACEVARQMEIRCTNGGLVSGSVAMLLYDHYLQSGEMERAEDFASRAFTAAERQMLDSPRAQEALQKTKGFLDALVQAQPDYLNFHWYIADPLALEEVAAYLQERAGLPLLTNEIGQRDDDPQTTRALLAQADEIGLPYVIWFSIDSLEARALMDPDGSLRASGEAYREYLLERPDPVTSRIYLPYASRSE